MHQDHHVWGNLYMALSSIDYGMFQDTLSSIRVRSAFSQFPCSSLDQCERDPANLVS